MIARPDEPGLLTADLPTWRISSERYLQMIETGVLGPDDRVELIAGTIVPMSPAGRRHVNALLNLSDLLGPLRERYHLITQATLEIRGGQAFNPDVMLLHRREGGYRDRLPGPGDVALLIEVADASLRRDRQVKGPVYAAAGAADYWIADLEREVVVVHREPEGDAYNRIETFRGNQTVTPLAAADFAVRVADIFA